MTGFGIEIGRTLSFWMNKKKQNTTELKAFYLSIHTLVGIGIDGILITRTS